MTTSPTLSSPDSEFLADLAAMRAEREAAEAEAARMKAEAEAADRAAREALLPPEKKEAKKTAAELLIDQFETGSAVEIRNRQLEQKYGRGAWGWMRAFLAGQHDVRVDEHGEVHRNLWLELSRRGLRTFANRRTIIGGGALAVIGLMTGGAGLTAARGFLGGVIGHAIGETISAIEGGEARARIALTQAQLTRWGHMQTLARQYKEAINPGQKLAKLEAVINEQDGVAASAMSHEVGQAEEDLAAVLAKQDKLRNCLGLAGMGAGMVSGLLAAKAAAATGGMEGGIKAFGKVDTDLSWFKELFGVENAAGVENHLHHVYQENGQWNYLYGSAEESAQRFNEYGAGGMDFHSEVSLDDLPKEAQFGSHAWGPDSESLKIYGYATAKALGVLGATTVAGMTGGDGGGRERRADAATARHRTEQLARTRKKIIESAGITLPRTEAAAQSGDVVGVTGLDVKIPKVVERLGKPWNPEWKYARLELTRNPRTNASEGRVIFFKSDDELRGTSATSAPESFPITPADWQTLSREARVAWPVQGTTRDQDTALADPAMAQFIDAAVGKPVVFVDKPDAAKLQVLVNQGKYPLPGALDPKAKYEVAAVNRLGNVVTLRDVTRGGTVHVDLLKFRDIVKPFPAPAVGAPGAPVAPGAPAAPAAEALRANWKEIMDELADRGEPKVTNKSVWVIEGGDVDAQVATGRDKGTDISLGAGRYVVVRPDQKNGYVVVRSLEDGTAEPARVAIDQFANLRSEGTRLAEIFRERETAGDRVPPGRQIRPGQRYEYQFTAGSNPDPAPREYRVVNLNDNMISLIEHTPAAGATAVERRVSPLELARDGTFV